MDKQDVVDHIENERSMEGSDSYDYVRKRDEVCQVCGGIHQLEVHHVIYRSQGGETTQDNMVLLCKHHHNMIHYGVITIEEFEPGVTLKINKSEMPDEMGLLKTYLDESAEIEDKAEVGFQAHQLVKRTRAEINKHFIRLGVLLHVIETHELYCSMGYDSMPDYLRDPEVDISVDKANRLKRVARRLRLSAGVEEEKIAEVGVHKADRISQFYEDREAVEWLLGVASTSDRNQLGREIKEIKHGGEESPDYTEYDVPESNPCPGWVSEVDHILNVISREGEKNDLMVKLYRMVSNIFREYQLKRE